MDKKNSAISHLEPTRLIKPSERPPVPLQKERLKRFRFFSIMWQLLKLFTGNGLLKLQGKKSETRRGQRIEECLQELGLVWIRVAQTFSLRGTKISDRRGLNLMDMNDRGEVLPFTVIRKVIETQLKLAVEDIFDQFEEKPFAATTVSQLHRAHLKKEDVWTAVKVQQPGAEAVFNRDLTLFRRLIGLLKFFSIRTNMRWDELFHELQEIKVRELNYYYEAAALETLEKNLEGRQVHVPRIYRKYCTQRVLVMKFIQGALLSDVIRMQRTDPQRVKAWLKANNINTKKVARRLFQATFKHVFQNNFFHGDMTTGNVILMRDSHVAVIQCRSAGSLEVESLRKQAMFLRALSESEFATAAEIYFLLASRLPRVDLGTVKESLIRVWRVWETRTYIKTLRYEQKSLAYMTGQVNGVVNDSQFAPLWSFTKLTRTWVHLDNAMAALSPDLNYMAQLRLYFKTADRQERIAKLKRLPERISSALTALHEVPNRTAEYTLFKETLMRRQGQVVQGSASKLDAVIATGFGFCSFLLLIIAGFFGAVFLMDKMQVGLEPFLGSQLNWLAQQIPAMNVTVWMILFLCFVFLFVAFGRQKKRFRGREFGTSNNNGTMEP